MNKVRQQVLPFIPQNEACRECKDGKMQGMIVPDKERQSCAIADIVQGFYGSRGLLQSAHSDKSPSTPCHVAIVQHTTLQDRPILCKQLGKFHVTPVVWQILHYTDSILTCVTALVAAQHF